MPQWEWLRQNRTLVTAIACTVALGVLVFLHKIEISRCVIALIFTWSLASHSKDIQDHKVEVISALQHGAKAGLELRAGQVGACATDLEDAGSDVTGIVNEVRAEHAGKDGA